MAKARNYRNIQTYTYESLDGSKSMIQAGQDGVTEELILFLQGSDRDMALQARYQQENTSYAFQNQAAWYEADAEDEACGPWERIADPAADIMGILFPEEGSAARTERMKDVLEELTEGQRELIYQLYGMKKSIIEIANEENVTEAAIRNRRNKILQRVKKLMRD